MQESSKSGIIVSIIALLVILGGAFLVISSLTNKSSEDKKQTQIALDAQSKNSISNSSISRAPGQACTFASAGSPKKQVIPANPENLKKVTIKDTQIGTGAEVSPGDFVCIDYKGTLQNGKEFDSSFGKRNPFETQIGVRNVIEGWDLGILGLKEGGKRQITIPSELGYGNRSSGAIPPNSTLVFDVELIKVKK